MGDQNTVLDAAAAAHLLRRTGFGAKASDIERFEGLSRGDAADILLSFVPKGFKPTGRYFENGHDKWIKYMIKSRFPLNEKLVLFWHDHFATAFSKVVMANDTKSAVSMMARQNQTLRLLCKGDMRVLVKAIGKDPAMIEFLDTVRNRKAIPNENYPRELLELFTLGVYDLLGNANYTQDDIVQIARAFTGWRYDGFTTFFRDSQHDYTDDFPERGPKEIFGTTGGFAEAQAFDVNGEGEPEIDAVVDIIFQHRDSAGENTVARRTARRLLEYFTHGGFANPSAPLIAVIDQVIASSGFDTNFDVAGLLREIFVHDEFYASLSDGSKRSIKWPVDYTVSTLRLLQMKLKGRDQVLTGGDYQRVVDHLTNMGQLVLEPPSVFGWDWETSWTSSATLLARYSFARDIGAARYGGTRFKPEKLLSLSLSAPGDIVDKVTEILGVKDQLSAAERQVLIDYVGGTLDLNDYDERNRKLHGLFAVVMQSPAYQLH